MNNVIRQMSSALGIVFVSIYYEVRRGQLAITTNSLEEASLQAINEGFLSIAVLTTLTIPVAFLLEKASRQEDKRHKMKN